jgi:hypothetical protein
MKALRLVALVLGSSMVSLTAVAQTLDFEKESPGAVPGGFTVAQTGPGAAPRWVVEEDVSAPSGSRVLVQRSADETRSRFPLAIYDGASLADGTLSVRFKAISGRIDQAAGLVWRYRDPENYYIVRANALEGNVVLYKVERGKRSDLDPIDAGLFAYGKKAPVRSGVWQELRVEVKGDLFRVSLDGSHLFDVRDATFKGPGKVGLWTKADSVTAFDNLQLAAAAPRA